MRKQLDLWLRNNIVVCYHNQEFEQGTLLFYDDLGITIDISQNPKCSNCKAIPWWNTAKISAS